MALRQLVACSCRALRSNLAMIQSGPAIVSPSYALLARPAAATMHTSATLHKRRRKRMRQGARGEVRVDPARIDSIMANYPRRLQEVLALCQQEVDDALDQFRERLSRELSIRTDLRAFANLPVRLEDEGVTKPLNHLGQLVLKNPHLLELNFAGHPTATKPARDAILRSGLGVHPQHEGYKLLVRLPRVTRQRRAELAQGGRAVFNELKRDKLGQAYKVHSKRLVKAKGTAGVSEDDWRMASAHLGSIVKTAEADAMQLLTDKQRELTEEF